MLTFETAAIQGVAGIIEKLKVFLRPMARNLTLIYQQRIFPFRKLHTKSLLWMRNHQMRLVEYLLW